MIDLKTKFCTRPFDNFEINRAGDAFFCCQKWLNMSIGNVFKNSPEELWNSARAKEIRRSIIDGDFRHCSREFCPRIANDVGLLDRSLVNIDEYVNKKPEIIKLSYDITCNLVCPSCRNTKNIDNDDVSQARFDAFYNAGVRPWLQTLKFVHISGSGEPFSSKHFIKVMKEITSTPDLGHIKIDLHSNGTLLNRRTWNKLGLQDRVRNVSISIDAATKETYAKTRVLGNWNDLIRNLFFIKQKKKRGQIGTFMILFVVQQSNYKEIPKFVELGHRVGADLIFFDMIVDFRTGTDLEFSHKYIGNPKHPEYQEYLEVLSKLDLSDPKVITTGISKDILAAQNIIIQN
jgi:molybdenum cofactor biosynthesis enzyme MoaA